MLRSRGERPGRFHRSAMGPAAYFSRPGATIRTSSDIDMVFCSAWADEEATRKSDAMVANKLLIPNSSEASAPTKSVYRFAMSSISGQVFHGALQNAQRRMSTLCLQSVSQEASGDNDACPR